MKELEANICANPFVFLPIFLFSLCWYTVVENVHKLSSFMQHNFRYSLYVRNLFLVTKKKKKKKTQILNKFFVFATLLCQLKDLQFIFQKNIFIILTASGFSWSSSDNIQQRILPECLCAWRRFSFIVHWYFHCALATALLSLNCNISYAFGIFNHIAKNGEFLTILVSESLFSIFTFFGIQDSYC